MSRAAAAVAVSELHRTDLHLTIRSCRMPFADPDGGQGGGVQEVERIPSKLMLVN